MASSYVLYKPDCEIYSSFYDEMAPSIVFAMEEPLTADERELLASEFRLIGCRNCGHCRGSDGDQPLTLWIETETELRQDLQHMVRLKAEYHLTERWPDTLKGLHEEIRALVQAVLSIREPNKTGLAPPAETAATDGDGAILEGATAENPLIPPAGFLGGRALAVALGIHDTQQDAFLRQLERKRKGLGDDCWCEVHNSRPNSPKFLYCADSPKVRNLAARYKTPKPV